MLPLLGLLGLASMGLIFTSGCGPRLPPKNRPQDPEPEGEKIARMAYKRLRKLEPKPQLDTGCARLHFHKYQRQLHILGKANGNIEDCEIHSYLAVHPELFPDLTHRLYPAGAVPWALGEKRQVLKGLISRVQDDLKDLGWDLTEPANQREMVELIWLLAKHETLQPWREHRFNIEHTIDYNLNWSSLDSKTNELSLNSLWKDLNEKESFLNLDQKTSQRLDPGTQDSVHYLFFLALLEAGLEPHFLFYHSPYGEPQDFPTGKLSLPIPKLTPELDDNDNTLKSRATPWVERLPHTNTPYFELTPRQFLGWYLTQLTQDKRKAPANPTPWLLAASQLFPEYPVPLLLRARYLINKQDYSQAADLIRAAGRMAPKDPTYDKALAKMRIQQFTELFLETGTIPDIHEKWIDEVIWRLENGLRNDTKDYEINDLMAHALLMRQLLPLSSIWNLIGFDIDETLSPLLPHFKRAIDGGSKQDLAYLGTGLFLLRQNPQDQEGIELIFEGIRRGKQESSITRGYLGFLLILNREHLLPERARKFLEKEFVKEFGSLPTSP